MIRFQRKVMHNPQEHLVPPIQLRKYCLEVQKIMKVSDDDKKEEITRRDESINPHIRWTILSLYLT